MPDHCPDLADALYGAPWREHIMPHRVLHRVPLGFQGAKALAHRAFDGAGLPRPFVKRMPLHYAKVLG